MEAEVKKAGGMESIAGDVAQMERELQQRQMKRAKLVGARDAVRYQIRQHEAELNKPSFRSLDEEYRKLLIQHKVSALLWRMCVRSFRLSLAADTGNGDLRYRKVLSSAGQVSPFVGARYFCTVSDPALILGP
jgi:hypothetical protein